VRAEILLEVEVRHLLTLGGLQEVTKLLIKHEYTTVVGVLETIVFHVLIDSTRHRASRDELTLGETQESAKLLGNLLLTVEAVVLRAVSRLLTGGILLRGTDLTDNLGEGLDVVADGGDFGENGFGRHYTYHRRNIFKYINRVKPSTNMRSESLVNTLRLYIFPYP